MQLSILTENTAGGKFLAEHGLSYIIDIEDRKILFDTGHSDVFLKNSLQMGIDIENDIDTIVLSHGHWDHGDGLKYLKNKRLILHPAAFTRRFRKRDFSPIGLSPSRSEIKANFELIETKTPIPLAENVIFLGEIPRENSFEAQATTFVDDFRNEDFVPDDSALTVVENNELIVITGCSHSGICNIVEYAKKVTGITKIRIVLGGFHLKEDDEQTRKTINYMKENGIDQVYPSHCTELPALAAFYNTFKCLQLKTGMVLNL